MRAKIFQLQFAVPFLRRLSNQFPSPLKTFLKSFASGVRFGLATFSRSLCLPLADVDICPNQSRSEESSGRPCFSTERNAYSVGQQDSSNDSRRDGRNVLTGHRAGYARGSRTTTAASRQVSLDCYFPLPSQSTRQGQMPFQHPEERQEKMPAVGRLEMTRKIWPLVPTPNRYRRPFLVRERFHWNASFRST